MNEVEHDHDVKAPYGFCSVKAAQLTAHFLITIGRPVAKDELLLMLYLSDRITAEKYGRLMLFDSYHAVETGPTPTGCSLGLAGHADRGEWAKHLEVRDGMVALREGVRAEDLDHLSGADRTAANDAMSRLRPAGGAPSVLIVEWAMSHLPEYRIARERGGDAEITAGDIARGFDHPNPEEFVGIDDELRGLADPQDGEFWW